MRVLVAPDKFKGSLSSVEAAAAIARGVRAAGAEAIECAVADGGEGTLDALVAVAGGTIMGVIARGPLGVPVRAHLGRLSDGTGVVEMAQASGLDLVPPRERDVLRASSQGTGELIKGALARRPPRVVVGLGGSATVDGGMGLGKALGLRFLDDDDRPLPDGGGALERLAHIDPTRLDERVRATRILIAADVEAPLLGPRGAAAAYGPQKGAGRDEIEQLERGLKQLAARLARDMGAVVADVEGAGAAGGAGAMLLALGGAMHRGADFVLEMLDFGAHLAAADLVITGEGSVDEQTMAGKAALRVAAAARSNGVPCVALAGRATVQPASFADIRTLIDHFGGDEARAMTEAASGLEHLARRIVAERLRAAG